MLLSRRWRQKQSTADCETPHLLAFAVCSPSPYEHGHSHQSWHQRATTSGLGAESRAFKLRSRKTHKKGVSPSVSFPISNGEPIYPPNSLPDGHYLWQFASHTTHAPSDARFPTLLSCRDLAIQSHDRTRPFFSFLLSLPESQPLAPSPHPTGRHPRNTRTHTRALNQHPRGDCTTLSTLPASRGPALV
jgi:hypothetical protein